MLFPSTPLFPLLPFLAIQPEVQHARHHWPGLAVLLPVIRIELSTREDKVGEWFLCCNAEGNLFCDIGLVESTQRVKCLTGRALDTRFFLVDAQTDLFTLVVGMCCENSTCDYGKWCFCDSGQL